MDALEMMKQGVRRLLVPKSVAWKGMSKRFSILYNGKWLKNVAPTTSRPSAPTIHGKFCCLSREDVIRFLIGCLGALAPVPLSSISSLGAITPQYAFVDASVPAIEAVQTLPHDPSAVAVVKTLPDGRHDIIGEISAYKLWKCDYLATAWALANLSACQFVMGVEDTAPPRFNPDTILNNNSTDNSCSNGNVNDDGESVTMTRPKKFSSRSIGFFSSSSASSLGRNMYRGRSTPLMCKMGSSLAAVMAQMLSHRATHVWVTGDDENCEEIIVGLVGYADILAAVTRFPAAAASETILAAPSVLETAAAIPERTGCVPEAGAA